MKNNSTDLRGFLLMLQSDNELVRVKRDINPEYEIAAVTARLDRKQTVLFGKVRGSKNRVVCNVIATTGRFYLALGGTSYKAHEADVKKNIHARFTATILKAKERFEIAKIRGEEKVNLSEYL